MRAFVTRGAGHDGNDRWLCDRGHLSVLAPSFASNYGQTMDTLGMTADCVDCGHLPVPSLAFKTLVLISHV